MKFAPGSRVAPHAFRRRIGVRRHIPAACIASIVIALQPAPSIEVQQPAPPRLDAPLDAAMFQMKACMTLRR